MKNQTLSIEQMKHLKDLGVDVSKASMCWWLPMERVRSEEGYSLDVYRPNVHEQMSDDPIIMAFTLQDILELLPKLIVKNKSFLDIRPNVIYSDLCISYMDVNANETIISFRSDNIIDAAYKMLCWLAENDYLNKEEQ